MEDSGSQTAKRVLIVDDSEITIALLQAQLADAGLTVLTATSAEEATRIITKSSTRPELVLLDVNMPGIDGAQFCKFIKKNSMFESVKVVFCSGMDLDELKSLAEACGADGFVHKDDYLGKWVAKQCS